jgi:hypothetical protein
MAKFVLKRDIQLFSFTLLTVVLFSAGTARAPSKAQNLDTLVRKSELEIDTSVVEDSGDYAQPASILITPIFLNNEEEIDGRDWYKGLFYYFSSERYLFKDIPAHYVVDNKGKIYEGVIGGVEKQVIVKEAPSSPILIFYLANRGENDFSLSAKDTLTDLLLQLINENAIKPEKIEISGLKLHIDDEEKEASLTKEEIFGTWNITKKTIIETLTAKYSPVKKTYKLEIVEFNNPENTVQVGAEVVIKIKLKNIGINTMFAESDSELLLTKKDGNDSRLFLNEHWVSKTQTPIFSTGDVLLAGNEKSFDIKVSVPFEPGEYSEQFEIKTAGGSLVANSDVTITLNIDRGDLKLLEILDTETGTLNIRDNPGASSSVVDKASPGQRYIWTERSDSGWYKIQITDGYGWVYGRYTREL